MCRGGGTTQIKSQPMPLSNILRVVSCPHQTPRAIPTTPRARLAWGMPRYGKIQGNPTYQSEARIHLKHRVASGHDDNLASHSV